MFDFEASLSATAKCEKTSNMLLEVFQNASSKWSTTGRVPRIIRPQRYAEIDRNITSYVSTVFNQDLSMWNSGDSLASCNSVQGEDSCLHPRSTAAERDQNSPRQDVSASLDPAPLPTSSMGIAAANNIYTVILTEEQPPMTTASAPDQLEETRPC